MPIDKRIVADDGLHRVEQTTVSLPRRGRTSQRDMRAVWHMLTDAAEANTFEGAIRDAERYWRQVKADPTAPRLSKPWYAAEIQRRIAWMREERHKVPHHRRQAQSLDPRIRDLWAAQGYRIEMAKEPGGTERAKRAWTEERLEVWITSATQLGAIIEEARWRFGFGDVARLGTRVYRNQSTASKKGTKARTEKTRRADEVLLDKVRPYRELSPTGSTRQIALTLLHKDGKNPDHKQIDALATKIRRAEQRAEQTPT